MSIPFEAVSDLAHHANLQIVDVVQRMTALVDTDAERMALCIMGLATSCNAYAEVLREDKGPCVGLSERDALLVVITTLQLVQGHSPGLAPSDPGGYVQAVLRIQKLIKGIVQAAQ